MGTQKQTDQIFELLNRGNQMEKTLFHDPLTGQINAQSTSESSPDHQINVNGDDLGHAYLEQ